MNKIGGTNEHRYDAAVLSSIWGRMTSASGEHQMCPLIVTPMYAGDSFERREQLLQSWLRSAGGSLWMCDLSACIRCVQPPKAAFYSVAGPAIPQRNRKLWLLP